MDVSSRKADVRRRLRASRRELTGEALAGRAERIAAALEAAVPSDAVVAGYLPMAGEPDVLPFLEGHVSRGGTVFLPVTPTDGSRELRWARWAPGMGLRPHPVLPLQEPAFEPGSELSLEGLAEEGDRLTMLVPALAVDEEGGRMGQGGGFYDTTLGALPSLRASRPGLDCRLFAVVHASELLPAGSFPVEPHDLRVEAAVTENGVVPLRSAYN